MNIPQDTLQTVADAAFEYIRAYGALKTGAESATDEWEHQDECRRAVIQHALDNPAIAPWLNVQQAWPPVGEYTDAELMRAWNHREYRGGKMSTTRNLRSFLAALPRRESPALAEAIARAEKAEAELFQARQLLATRVEASRLDEALGEAREAQAELAVLKSSQLGILRPIAEMPETVPEGCFMVSGWQASGKYWIMNGAKHREDTHFAILLLPAAAEAVSSVAYTYPQPEWVDAPEPAAQVPLGPEDIKPGAIITNTSDSWYKVKYVTSGGIRIDIQGSNLIDYEELQKDGWSINTSIPDTGRWDKDAWRDCSKPAGKEVAK